MTSKGVITSHVLDTSLGRPAEGIPVTLEQETGGHWTKIASGRTDSDGRISDLLYPSIALGMGHYRITFELSKYFKEQGRKYFYPSANITFLVEDPQQHYHVPLLLSGFGFSTYRGS